MIWKLSWYYFADIVTLLKKVKAQPGRPQGMNREYLVNRLLSLPVSDVQSILSGQEINGEARLFSEIRNLTHMTKRRLYRWTTQNIGLDIEVCSMLLIPDLDDEPILTPTTLYIPWPIDVGMGRKIKYTAREMDIMEYNPDRDLRADKDVCCIDWLVTEQSLKSGFIEELGEAKTSEERHRVIRLYGDAIDQPTRLPESMVITASKDLPTNLTYLQSDGERLYMHIGLKPQETGLFEKWPDGAFLRNENLP